MKIELDIPFPEGTLDEDAKDRLQRAALEPRSSGSLTSAGFRLSKLPGISD